MTVAIELKTSGRGIGFKHMRYPLLLSLTVLSFAALVCVGGTIAVSKDSMDDFRWKNRLILVFAEPTRVEPSVKILQAAAEEIEERQVLWFVMAGETVRTNYGGRLSPDLRAALIEPHRADATAPLEVVLIGKDGGVKFRAPELDLQEIFTRIDAMPMRRSEMRRNHPNRKEE